MAIVENKDKINKNNPVLVGLGFISAFAVMVIHFKSNMLFPLVKNL